MKKGFRTWFLPIFFSCFCFPHVERRAMGLVVVVGGGVVRGALTSPKYSTAHVPFGNINKNGKRQIPNTVIIYVCDGWCSSRKCGIWL
jgi:hypothetical protein